jgi:hypothetical protein
MGPTQQQINEALIFFQCRANGAQEKEIQFYSGVLLAGMANGDVSLQTSPASPTVVATPNKGTTSPTPNGVGALLVVFSSDFTGTFDGLTINVAQTPSLSFNIPGKLIPSYVIVATAGSFWWETLT